MKVSELLAKHAGKIVAGAMASLLAGGITGLAFMQPAVEKAADYGAEAVRLYCQLPAVDRERFHSEIAERLGAGTAVRVTCPVDVR